jgi:heptosyltransferase-3
MNTSLSILQNAQNIAVIRTDRIGDLILTLPLCRALKQFNPKAKIVLYTRTYVQALLYQSEAVDKVVYVEENDEDFAKFLKEDNIEVCFFPRPRFKEVWAAKKAGVKLRIGTAYRWYSFLLNEKIRDHRKNAQFHEVQYNIRMLEQITGTKNAIVLEYPKVKAEAMHRVELLMQNFGLNINDDFFIIHPGSGGSAKDWQAHNMGKAAKQIARKTQFKILITGSRSEEFLCKRAEIECAGAYNLCGSLDLDELIALISVSKLLIANSTGVLHIAAAMQVPVIGLYPNTAHLSSRRWGPWSEKSVVFSPRTISPDEDQDNMNMIPIDMVIQVAIDFLNEYSVG